MSEKLTPERIREIVGHMGDERVLEILDTGATEAELARAMILAAQQELRIPEEPGLRTEVLHRLYDILRADLIEREEP